MQVRLSRLVVVFSSLLIAVAAFAGDDTQPHKCSASARECEQQIRSMLSGRRYLGALIGDEGGALVVKSVKPESPAERGGLAPGDRLMSVNGQSTAQADNVAFKKILSDAKQTGRLRLIVARRGILKPVDVLMQTYSKEQVDRIVAQHLTTGHAVANSAPGQ
jgi:predicted metalloprotease with PDZ domain